MFVFAVVSCCCMACCCCNKDIFSSIGLSVCLCKVYWSGNSKICLLYNLIRSSFWQSVTMMIPVRHCLTPCRSYSFPVCFLRMAHSIYPCWRLWTTQNFRFYRSWCVYIVYIVCFLSYKNIVNRNQVLLCLTFIFQMIRLFYSVMNCFEICHLLHSPLNIAVIS